MLRLIQFSSLRFRYQLAVINKLLLNSYYQITKALLLKSQIQRNKKLVYNCLILFKKSNKNFNKINGLPERF
ncbi:hypothetical protein A9G26_01700 [Gilliamella sp. Bim1-2]|nr:hypothetical protein A9G32_05300 [Gilliamella apicola]OCG52110.1 hypothetical protein A9G27_00815 [Gilliamella apicola]OCG52751.1 hypothetical protein A9G26_01700 [Gilliamella apicola]